MLATEAEGGDLAALVLRAIAAGRTKHNEIRDAVKAEPARVLDRLVQLRLVERVVPVTERTVATRRRRYRIADNFLAFWLRVLDRHRTAIDRGLGESVLPVLAAELDDFMGERWETRSATTSCGSRPRRELGEEIVDVGRWWRDPPCGGDRRGRAGGARAPAGAAPARRNGRVRVDGPPAATRAAGEGPRALTYAAELRYALVAREAADGDADVSSPSRAADMFDTPDARRRAHAARGATQLAFSESGLTLSDGVS